MRDGGLLLDVSRLVDRTVEPDRMTADVGPGKVASVFAADLDARGLFFPAGHCEGICLGGYLLQGGYGWNSSVLGPACESVLGLEVVTADGELIYCDAENHPDLYWAARGSGPGFFGVVTSFTLRIYPRPPVWGTCLYMYPIEVADEVFTWGRSISSELDDRVELQIHTARSFPGAGLNQPGITIAAPVFAGSEEEGDESPCPVGHLPGRGQGDCQPGLRADELGQLVHRGDDQLSEGASLYRRQHVHGGFRRGLTARHPRNHRNDATTSLAFHFHWLEDVPG